MKCDWNCNLVAFVVIGIVSTVMGILISKSLLASTISEGEVMQIQYLEIVTNDVDGVIATYSSTFNVQFSEPDDGLGGARTAQLAGGGLIGVRAPLRDDENPVIRPYWLVPNIDESHNVAIRAGGLVAVPPLEIPGHGKFSIYYQGGNDHGLWQM